MVPTTRERRTGLFTLSFQPGVRERLETFVARENERLAPARIDRTAVINAAIAEFLSRHDSDATPTAPMREDEQIPA